MDAMATCMATATDKASRKSCKETTAKEALAEQLGVAATDVSDSQLQEYIDGASS